MTIDILTSVFYHLINYLEPLWKGGIYFERALVLDICPQCPIVTSGTLLTLKIINCKCRW